MDVTANLEASVMSELFARQQARALLRRRSTLAERIADLRRLERAVLAHQPSIRQALWQDLRKSETEADLTELMPVLGEIRHAVRQLANWMRPRRAAASLAMLGTRAHITYQPKGVCLIISPWNYPFALTFGPLVSALAAGNTAMLKPSELSPASSAVIARIIGELFDDDLAAVFEGGPEISTALLDLPFDHIFFTGSPAIGRVVMAAAAQHLSSVTLELGGKSPAIVDSSADIGKAAASLMWGKFLNAGQTCIAPDYVYVHERVATAFLEASVQTLAKMFGPEPRLSPDYPRIINARHTARLGRLLDGALQDGARVVTPFGRDDDQKYLAPTLLTNVRLESALMREEIFGPLLPVLTYSRIDQVISHINHGTKPLALYVYGRNQKMIGQVLRDTASGGACVNAAVVHFTHPNLPFGGVNESGIGSAHGEFGFRAFSHERAELRERFSVLPWLYPPYTARVRRLVALSLKYFT